MAKTYHVGRGRRLVNTAMSPLARLGLAGRHTYILTVRGRRSGRSYSVPVILIEDGGRWLVSPYGDVSWALNARAAGEVELTRGGRVERLAIEEIGVEEAAPILRRYLTRLPIVRPFFDVRLGSSPAEFEAEAPHHPVFRLTAPQESQSESYVTARRNRRRASSTLNRRGTSS